MVAALSADGKTLTLVVRNGDRTASKGFTFDLSAFSSQAASASVHRTSRSEDLVSQPAITIENWRLVATAPAFSITTLVVPLE